jgi:hypothetical protein
MEGPYPRRPAHMSGVLGAAGAYPLAQTDCHIFADVISTDTANDLGRLSEQPIASRNIAVHFVLAGYWIPNLSAGGLSKDVLPGRVSVRA